MANSADFFDHSFGSPSQEPSALLGFSQNQLIRDAEHRDETSLPNALADANVRFILFGGNRAIIRKGKEAQALFQLDEISEFDPLMKTAILVGIDGKTPLIALKTKTDTMTLPEPWAAYDMRQVIYKGEIDDHTASTLGHAAALMHWNSANRFCGRCGTQSEQAIGGYRRDCPSCDTRIFPRTDPVVIMLAIRDNQCVMGRSPHFPEGWYSTLAGFLEHGETIEQAVRRETFEESGIEIGRVKYFASQPWPFPHSLMIGIHCEALTDKIKMDESELEDCRWFDRDEVQLMIKQEHPDGLLCPPTRAISSAIIQAWAFHE